MARGKGNGRGSAGTRSVHSRGGAGKATRATKSFTPVVIPTSDTPAAPVTVEVFVPPSPMPGPTPVAEESATGPRVKTFEEIMREKRERKERGELGEGPPAPAPPLARTMPASSTLPSPGGRYSKQKTAVVDTPGLDLRQPVSTRLTAPRQVPTRDPLARFRTTARGASGGASENTLSSKAPAEAFLDPEDEIELGLALAPQIPGSGPVQASALLTLRKRQRTPSPVSVPPCAADTLQLHVDDDELDVLDFDEEDEDNSTRGRSPSPAPIRPAEQPDKQPAKRARYEQGSRPLPPARLPSIEHGDPFQRDLRHSLPPRRDDYRVDSHRRPPPLRDEPAPRLTPRNRDTHDRGDYSRAPEPLPYWAPPGVVDWQRQEDRRPYDHAHCREPYPRSPPPGAYERPHPEHAHPRVFEPATRPRSRSPPPRARHSPGPRRRLSPRRGPGPSQRAEPEPPVRGPVPGVPSRIPLEEKHMTMAERKQELRLRLLKTDIRTSFSKEQWANPNFALRECRVAPNCPQGDSCAFVHPGGSLSMRVCLEGEKNGERDRAWSGAE